MDEFEGGLQLQCDVSHRVLRMETAFDILKDLVRRKVPDIKTEAEKQLLGAVVLTRCVSEVKRSVDSSIGLFFVVSGTTTSSTRWTTSSSTRRRVAPSSTPGRAKT